MNTEKLDEAPFWTDEDFSNAVHRVGLKPVGKKVKINLTIDPDVVEWYKTVSVLAFKHIFLILSATMRKAPYACNQISRKPH